MHILGLGVEVSDEHQGFKNECLNQWLADCALWNLLGTVGWGLWSTEELVCSALGFSPPLPQGQILLYLLYLLNFLFLITFIYLFYLFLAVLGLRCCARALSSRGEWGPLFIAVHGPLMVVAPLVVEHGL